MFFQHQSSMKLRLLRTFVTIVACGAFAFPATMEGKPESDKAAVAAYNKVIQGQIGSIWYRHVGASNTKSMPAGTVVINFRITPNGQVKNLRVVSNTSDQKWATIAVYSILEAKFPPIPKDALQGREWLDVKNMSFKLFDDTAKKSDHAKTIRAL
jgi:expansin (peptidoglycan-binding protein)